MAEKVEKKEHVAVTCALPVGLLVAAIYTTFFTVIFINFCFLWLTPSTEQQSLCEGTEFPRRGCLSEPKYGFLNFETCVLTNRTFHDYLECVECLGTVSILNNINTSLFETADSNS